MGICKLYPAAGLGDLLSSPPQKAEVYHDADGSLSLFFRYFRCHPEALFAEIEARLGTPCGGLAVMLARGVQPACREVNSMRYSLFTSLQEVCNPLAARLQTTCLKTS